MLVRRGLRPRVVALDTPFPPGFAEGSAGAFARHLDHYAFRLFLRGAIQHGEEFSADSVTDYVEAAQAVGMARALVDLGLAEVTRPGRFRLRCPVASFGPTLEWYVGRELARRLGFDVVTGVKLRVPGLGGDLDVVAAAEGRLVYLELKSSPPKHLSDAEVAAFFARVRCLRPHLTLFVMDTALRLSDKVVPMLVAEAGRGASGAQVTPRCMGHGLWAVTPHLYAVGAKPSLMGNVGAAIADGFRALAPPVP
jgi:hypothetical protein